MIAVVVPKLPVLALPVTFNDPRVPTVVKLEVTIVAPNVVPVKLAAFAAITVLDAAVNCPCPLTVNVATRSPLPYVAAVTAVLVILNCVPVNVNPVPAVYAPAPENCTQLTGLVPTVVTGSVITQPVLSYNVPAVTNVKSPPAISAEVSKSVERVNTVLLVRS